MSRFMTQEEIDAEQALLRSQQMDTELAAIAAPDIDPEVADHVTPLDLLQASHYTTREIRNERFAICKECPRLFGPTRTCKECGCFMAMKTWLKEASCPLAEPKWTAVP